MPSAKNEAMVAELTEKFQRASSVVMVDYRGLDVTKQQELRGEMRKAELDFQVVKNRLLLIAAKQAGIDVLPEEIEGQTAVAIGFGDVVTAPKVAYDISKKFDQLKIKSGFLPDKYLTPDLVESLAKIPGRDQLNAQLVGVLAQTMRGFLTVLNGPSSQLVRILEAQRAKLSEAA